MEDWQGPEDYSKMSKKDKDEAYVIGESPRMLEMPGPGISADEN